MPSKASERLALIKNSVRDREVQGTRAEKRKRAARKAQADKADGVVVFRDHSEEAQEPRAQPLPADAALETVADLASEAFGFEREVELFFDEELARPIADEALWRAEQLRWAAGGEERRLATVKDLASRAAEAARGPGATPGDAFRRIEGFEQLYELLDRRDNLGGIAASEGPVRAVLGGLKLHDGEDEVASAAAAVGWKMAEKSGTLATKLVRGLAPQLAVALLQREALRREDARAGKPNALKRATRRKAFVKALERESILKSRAIAKLAGAKPPAFPFLFCTRRELDGARHAGGGVVAGLLGALAARDDGARAVAARSGAPWLLASAQRDQDAVRTHARVLCAVLGASPAARDSFLRRRRAFETLVELAEASNVKTNLLGAGALAAVLRERRHRALVPPALAARAFEALASAARWAAEQAPSPAEVQSIAGTLTPDLQSLVEPASCNASVATRDSQASFDPHAVDKLLRHCGFGCWAAASALYERRPEDLGLLFRDGADWADALLRISAYDHLASSAAPEGCAAALAVAARWAGAHEVLDPHFPDRLATLVEHSYSLAVRTSAAVALARATCAPGDAADAFFRAQGDARLAAVLALDIGSTALDDAISAALAHVALHAAPGEARGERVLKEHVNLLASRKETDDLDAEATQALRRECLGIWALARNCAFNRRKLNHFGAPAALARVLRASAPLATLEAAAAATWQLARDAEGGHQMAVCERPPSSGGIRPQRDQTREEAELTSKLEQTEKEIENLEKRSENPAAPAELKERLEKKKSEKKRASQSLDDLRGKMEANALAVEAIRVQHENSRSPVPALVDRVTQDARRRAPLRALAVGALCVVARSSEDALNAVAMAAPSLVPALLKAVAAPLDVGDSQRARHAAVGLQILAVDLLFLVAATADGRGALDASDDSLEAVCVTLVRDPRWDVLRGVGCFRCAKLACLRRRRVELLRRGLPDAVAGVLRDEGAPPTVRAHALHCLLNLSVDDDLREAICDAALPELLDCARAAEDVGDLYRDVEARHAQAVLANLSKTPEVRSRLFAVQLSRGSSALHLERAGARKLHAPPPFAPAGAASIEDGASLQHYMRAKRRPRSKVSGGPPAKETRKPDVRVLHEVQRSLRRPVSRLWDSRPVHATVDDLLSRPSTAPTQSLASGTLVSTSLTDVSLLTITSRPASPVAEALALRPRSPLRSSCRAGPLAGDGTARDMCGDDRWGPSVARVRAPASGARGSSRSPRLVELDRCTVRFHAPPPKLEVPQDQVGLELPFKPTRLSASVAFAEAVNRKAEGAIGGKTAAALVAEGFYPDPAAGEDWDDASTATPGRASPVRKRRRRPRRARVSKFERTPGAKVYEELFPEYVLRPEGPERRPREHCSFYYSPAAVSEASDPGEAVAPRAPDSLHELWQGPPPTPEPSCPGPGAGGTPLEPSAERAPDCRRHALVLCASTGVFGGIPEKPLTVHVRQMPKPEEAATEEAAREVERPGWRLETSIFAPRTREADSRGFFESDALINRALAQDYKLVLAEPRFEKFVRKNDEGVKGGEDVREELEDVRAGFEPHYRFLVTKAAFSISQNAYNLLLQDLRIPDEGTGCTFEECKKVFIVVNFEADKQSAQADLNEDKALMRYEFLEALVRMAHARFKEEIDDVSECVDALFERVLLPNAPPAAALEPDDFRRDRLYFEEVEAGFQPHLKALRLAFDKYAMTNPDGGRASFSIVEWMLVLSDGRLIGDELTVREARLCFWQSRMVVADEVRSRRKFVSLSWVEFLEALARVADLVNLPTDELYEESGATDLVDYEEKVKAMLPEDQQRYRRRRPSAGLLEPKSRPLGGKVDKLCRSLLGHMALACNGVLQFGGRRARLVGTYISPGLFKVLA